MPAYLQLLSGQFAGAAIPLIAPKFMVGREIDCQFRVNNPTLSRYHCVFLQDGYTLRIRDLGSKNGTIVNGTLISGDVILSHDDLVSLGNLTLRVDLSPEGPGPTPESLQQLREALEGGIFDGDTHYAG
jgi:pSer/pThr/pTyr-binding forkhead associated (FHA) protein